MNLARQKLVQKQDPFSFLLTDLYLFSYVWVDRQGVCRWEPWEQSLRPDWEDGYAKDDVDENASLIEGDRKEDHGAADHGVSDGNSGHDGWLAHK